MSHILYLEASARHDSHSHLIANELLAAHKSAHPDTTVTTRNLYNPAIPHVNEDFVYGALYGPLTGQARTPAQEEALRFSDELIAELKAADVIVISVPMYNFGVPSVLKAYIDQTVRLGATYGWGENGPFGLLSGKKIIAVSARGAGGYAEGGKYASANHVDGQIRVSAGYIGITDVTFIHIENALGGDEALQSSLTAARQHIKEIVGA